MRRLDLHSLTAGLRSDRRVPWLTLRAPLACDDICLGWSSREVPDPDEDDYDPYLLTWLSVGSEWTSVTFERDLTEVTDGQVSIPSLVAASQRVRGPFVRVCRLPCSRAMPLDELRALYATGFGSELDELRESR